MYQYDSYDQTILEERVAQFRDQTTRYLSGDLSEEDFRPLRLMNGLYVQRHAPMLRVAIPYGLLSSAQLRMLAAIARKYDHGYAHFSTRQNLQYNWPRVEDVPDILTDLASVEMHAHQTSGNCVRNVTSDHLAGVARDEIEDPRPYCEILRQWSTFHPEFAYLPRKFKIAVTGAEQDRAAVAVHDIGFYVTRKEDGEHGFRVLVGGGQGRTPYVGVIIRPWLETRYLLAYTEAILRVYNRFGRRDNRYKARIKILVNAIGAEEFTRQVEEEFEQIKDSVLQLDPADVRHVARFFQPPEYKKAAAANDTFTARCQEDPAFQRWVSRNTTLHRQDGYRSVFISLKSPQRPPGDATAEEMDAIAELAERYSFGQIRVAHDQNLVLADVLENDLHALWQGLAESDLATPNIGLLTDMICCPGLDFCSLANAGSIPIAAQINAAFDDQDYLHDIGELKIKMSGCMNACGHHHVGHIGILGVDKKGIEYYQLTLGGSAENDATIGDRLGPAIEKERVAAVIRQLLDVYVQHRDEDERFIDTYRRIGMAPFRERVYDSNDDRKVA